MLATRKTLDWEKKGGGNTECALKSLFGWDSIFSWNRLCWRSLSHFWEKLVSFRKCKVQQTGPTDWKHRCVLQNKNVYCKTQMYFAKQNTFLFWIKILMCFAIRLAIVITSVRTVMQLLVSTMKDDLRPHQQPPYLPLSAPCDYKKIWNRANFVFVAP